MYKIYETLNGKTVLNTTNNRSFSLEGKENTDYQQFKQDIVNGVELLDADGNPIIGDELTTFIGGLA